MLNIFIMNNELIFTDINMRAYSALCGYENHTSVVYNRLLSESLDLYRNNKSLDKMDNTKVKDIKKSTILVGSYEFLKYKWLDIIESYSVLTDRNKRIIDGTNRYFGQLLSILNVERIINWLYTLNNSHGSIQLGFKTPEAILIKLFIRGKTCDDICRASYISNDFTYFFDSLKKISEQLEHFDYWIEDDRNKTNWNAIKIYMMSTEKTIYGKTIAIELQLITPQMFIIKNQSTNHKSYERLRLARDLNVLNIYKSLGYNFNDMCDNLKLNNNMIELMETVLTLGNFIETPGRFIDDNSKPVHEVATYHKNSSLFFDELDDNLLIFGSYQKTPETKFQIVNKKLICVGSCNHYLTKQRIKMEPLKIIIKFIGDSITLQFSPNKECGWNDITNTKGQTIAFIENRQIWIRNRIYHDEIYGTHDTKYLTHNNTHELIIKMENNATSCEIDGKSIFSNISLNGAEILDLGYFHFGLCCWSETPVATILSIEITPLDI